MLGNIKNDEDSVLFFLKQNKKCVLFLVLFTMLFSLQKIVVYNMGYDTDEFLVNPSGTLYHWLAIDRYTLVLLKNIFPFLDGNLYVLNILTYINFFLFALTFLYFLNMDVRDNDWKKNFVCGALLISSPIFLEQFYFTLQSAEVSFALFVMAFCLVLTYKLLKDKKIYILFLIIPLLVFCYGIYQAFLNLYITGVLICLYKLNTEIHLQNIRRILTVVGVWVVSAIIYILIADLVKNSLNISGSEYLTDKISWISAPLLEVCFTVAVTIGRVVLGLGHVLNLSYIICGGVLLFYCLREKKISWKVFFLSCLFVSPLLLNIVTGSRLLIRSVIALPIFCSFVYFRFWQSNMKFKYIMYMILFSQIVNSQLLLYADNVRYKNDLVIAENIYRECNADQNTPIVFSGIERTEENVFSFKGQVIGCSFFEWSDGGENVDETRIYYFMKWHKMPFALPTQEQMEYIDDINFMSEYPNEGYAVEHNGCYYVNLGE